MKFMFLWILPDASYFKMLGDITNVTIEDDRIGEVVDGFTCFDLRLAMGANMVGLG